MRCGHRRHHTIITFKNVPFCVVNWILCEKSFRSAKQLQPFYGKHIKMSFKKLVGVSGSFVNAMGHTEIKMLFPWIQYDRGWSEAILYSIMRCGEWCALEFGWTMWIVRFSSSFVNQLHANHYLFFMNANAIKWQMRDPLCMCDVCVRHAVWHWCNPIISVNRIA